MKHKLGSMLSTLQLRSCNLLLTRKDIEMDTQEIDCDGDAIRITSFGNGDVLINLFSKGSHIDDGEMIVLSVAQFATLVLPHIQAKE
jgi:hypothetical protein